MIDAVVTFVSALAGGAIGLLILVGAYCLLHSIRNNIPR